MLEVLKSTVKPLLLDEKVLEAAYSIYLTAPRTNAPAISLRQLSRATGKSPLNCRNAIVEANSLGRFPDCELHP
ncbi:MAG: hypothetical protein AAFR26_23680 [Cyanobacteria bacterium J06626_4]